MCALCGLPRRAGEALCPHHHTSHDPGWAVANRIMCDLLHRGKVPTRLNPEEREDDFWAHSAA